jgi:GT2 family glycosyltransferase
MTSPSPLVSIVVVTFNNEAFVAECLSCALAQDYEPTELIVVDQGSSDGTIAMIQRDYPQVTLLQNERNTGFAAGMNRGIAGSRGEFVLLLNSDLFLESGFLSHAVRCLASHSASNHVGMLASVVHCYRDGRRTSEIDSTGMMFLPYHAIVNGGFADRMNWVAGPAGSVMFLSKAMLDDVRLPGGGYLDETYFCYGEDMELMLRAQMLGWRCVFVPILAGWHMGGASANAGPRYSDKPSPLLVHALKNRYLTLVACYPAGLLLRTLGWHLLTECGQILAPLMRRRWRQLACVLRAHGAATRLLPYALAKRGWLQRRRRVSCHYLRSLYVAWGPLRTFESLLRKA